MSTYPRWIWKRAWALARRWPDLAIDVEDVVSEIVVSCWRSGVSTEEPSRLGYTILRNRAVDALRKRIGRGPQPERWWKKARCARCMRPIVTKATTCKHCISVIARLARIKAGRCLICGERLPVVAHPSARIRNRRRSHRECAQRARREREGNCRNASAADRALRNVHQQRYRAKVRAAAEGDSMDGGGMKSAPREVRIELERFAYEPDCTLGWLRFGSFECYSLEPPWRDNNSHVSCIPEGEYEFFLREKPGRDRLQLLRVPDRSAIQVHVANVASELEGCIAPGNRLGVFEGQRAVIDSGAAMDRLLKELQAAHGENLRTIAQLGLLGKIRISYRSRYGPRP